MAVIPIREFAACSHH